MDSWLGVVDIYIIRNAFPIILHGHSFHLYTICQQIVSIKIRGYTVQHVVICFRNIICHHIFKRKHSVHVHIACAGDQIFLIGIFPGQLIPDQVASVIQIVSVYLVICNGMPASGLDMSNALPFSSGHQICSHTGKSSAAPSQAVQFTVSFERMLCQLIL